MKLKNYSLIVGNKLLFECVNLSFKNGNINHILGSNGIGKSCFAKSTIGLLKYSGEIDINDDVSLIGSYSGIPQDFKLADVKGVIESRYSLEHIETLYELLNINSLPKNIFISKMSDGQKQKIKLLVFLSAKPKAIILDEFTSALDKKSSLEIYKFLNDYSKTEDIIIINITHNLSDIENMPGYYYYIKNKQILEVPDKQEVFDLYIKGE